MPITLNDMTPVSLCIATQELFDGKRYRQNFCDNILLRANDKSLEQHIVPLKRELNAMNTQPKFLHGHKAAIISNIDKILSLASARYAKVNYKAVESIVAEGRALIKKVIFSENFQQLDSLESVFKSKVSLPVYSLFMESMKSAR